MKKILKIENNPFVKIYQHHAYGFGILGNSKEAKTWICNKYIQLVYSPMYGLDSFNYYLEFLTKQAPFIWEGVDNEILESFNIDLLDYIKYAINHNKYVWLCVDAYYISTEPAYKKRHMLHDSLIYGFDDEKRHLYKIGYTDAFHYMESFLSYEEFFNCSPCMIKFLSKNVRYEHVLDLSAIKNGMKRYLNIEEENLLEDINYQVDNFFDFEVFSKSIFGQESCKYINDIMLECIDSGKRIDWRPSSLILEHKQLMFMRINCLYEAGFIENISLLEEYKNCIKLAEIYRNLCIKYSFTGSKAYKKRMSDTIFNLLEIEKELILEVISQL